MSSSKLPESPLSAYLSTHTEIADPVGRGRYSGSFDSPQSRLLRSSSDNSIRGVRTLTETMGGGNVEQRLEKAQDQVRSLVELIQGQLQPEIESLRRENQTLVEKANSSAARQLSSRLSVSHQTDERERSADLVHAMDHLEKRFSQSESILKKTIEGLKQQLDKEKLAKSRLQNELDRLVRDLDTGINHMGLNTHERTELEARDAKAEAREELVRELQEQVQYLRATHQAETDTKLKALEVSLKEQHAREMAQMYESYELERRQASTKITATSELRKVNEMLAQLQYQNKFLLQLLEEKGLLVRSLTALLEAERTRSQSAQLSAGQIQQLRAAVTELVSAKRTLPSENESRNAKLAAKLAKAERRMREMQRYYAGEISQLSRMLNGLRSDRE